MKVMFECWEEPGSLTFAPKWSIDWQRDRGLISAEAKLVYSFEAETWFEAMSEHYRRQDWGPYHDRGDPWVHEPFDEKAGRVE